MKRAASTFAAVLCCLALPAAALAQASKAAAKSTPTKDAAPAVAPAPAPPSPELMKARTRPPVKGTAYIEFIQTPAKLVKGELIGQVKIKNASDSPIIGLKVDQYYYAGQKEVSACTSRVRAPMAAGEIVDVTISCPNAPGISSSNLMFTHVNGKVSPKAVKKFEDPKPAAAAPKK